MKIRNGFVSNSSSSSFIIAAPKGKEMKILVEIDLSELSEQKINSKEELLGVFEEVYGANTESKIKEEEYLWNWYQKALKAIEEGKIVYCGCVGNESDNPAELFIYNNGIGKTKDIEIIKDAGDD